MISPSFRLISTRIDIPCRPRVTTLCCAARATFRNMTTSELPASQRDSRANAAPPEAGGKLVMQIILRRDLVSKLDWPVGPLMAQSAHAATAVLHLHGDHPDVKTYMSGQDGEAWKHMRKAILEVADESSLRSLTAKLDTLQPRIPYHLWIEQPENIPTALALVPNTRPKALRKILDEVGCVLWK